jgi:hypothetical protein
MHVSPQATPFEQILQHDDSGLHWSCAGSEGVLGAVSMTAVGSLRDGTDDP